MVSPSMTDARPVRSSARARAAEGDPHCQQDTTRESSHCSLVVCVLWPGYAKSRQVHRPIRSKPNGIARRSRPRIRRGGRERWKGMTEQLSHTDMISLADTLIGWAMARGKPGMVGPIGKLG
jgi:hypothetical protein